MKYELMILAAPESTEEQVDALIQKYEAFINTNNGQFIGAEKWGRRPVMTAFRKTKNLYEAYYSLLHFEDTKGKLKELNYKLGIDENIIRHLVSIEKPKSEPIERSAS